MTDIIDIDPNMMERSKLLIAARIIAEGGTVCFPTETVYGLGADALSAKAVAKIFKAKGRPSDNPLIVHIAKPQDIGILAQDVPAVAHMLTKAFWPGPLTLVLRKLPHVPDLTTASMDTVAIRMPDHKLALKLIELAEVPIAAPSANLSTKPSPTTAEHVIEDLDGKVDVIIRSGSARIGLESTVIDLTVDPPVVLRPGGITVEQLRQVIGRVDVHPAILGKKTAKGKTKSPGMKYKHYAPKADTLVVSGSSANIKRKIRDLVELHSSRGLKVGVMCLDKHSTYKADEVIYLGCHKSKIASNLFNSMRELDSLGVDLIIVEGTTDEGLGLAIMDRIHRAAFKTITV